jgi:hypothetical protein
MTAQDVLLAMHAKYAAVRSYQDRGVVITECPSEPEADELTFRTFFCRPERFRFEWTERHPYSGLRHILYHQVIWSDGTGAFSYSDADRITRAKENLTMAIAGATGVSRGAAHTVSSLLLAEVGGFSLPQLQRLTLDERDYEGVALYRIGGYHPHGHFYEADVGRHDLLLRKLSVHKDDGAWKDEIRRDIQIDEAINEQVFHFRPPV